MLGMENVPTPGTDVALHATFRLVSNDLNVSRLFSTTNFIEKSVLLEPFHLPGMIVQQRKEQNQSFAISTDDSLDSLFIQGG